MGTPSGIGAGVGDVQRGIVLQIAQTLNVSFTLKQASGEAVTLVAREPLVELDRKQPSTTLDRRFGVLRGGALEPAAHALPTKEQAKAHANSQALFSRRNAERLSLSGGASIRFRLSSSWGITSGSDGSVASTNKKGDPVGRPPERAARESSRPSLGGS